MKTNPLTSLTKLTAMLAAAAIPILSSPQVHAAAFTVGNLVVLQYGDGSAALGSGATAEFALEFQPSTANQASPVQTITIPATGATRLTGAGSGTSEGFITRSTNLTSIVFGGYDSDAGVAAIAGTTATVANRVVGRLDVGGNYTRGAGGSTVAFSGSAMRGVASDGTSFWEAGTASTSGTGGGMWYSAAGAAPIRIGNGNASGNIRVARIFNGNLYLSTGSGTIGIWAYTGVPTAAATAVNVITVATSSPYDFAFNPAGNVAYICDDGSLASGGGIQKWTFNGTSWSLAYTFGTAAGLTAGCRGLAVDFSGANPVLYATTADGTTKLVTITDTGSAALATTLATAGSNKAFRGVALAPIATSSGPPIITGVSPAGATNASGNNVSFAVSASGSLPLSYFWYKEISGLGGSTNLIPTATGPTLSIPASATTDSANYQVIVSNSVSPFTATSSVVALLITDAPPSVVSITPATLTNTAGLPASFTVTTAGSLPISYFWYKEIPGLAGSTNLIPTATTATLSFAATAVSDTASYQVVVSNSIAPFTATSPVVSLVVTAAPPVITGLGPVSQSQNAGLNASFTATNSGTPPLTYLWYKGAVPVPGSEIAITTNNTLTLVNLTGDNTGSYVVVVTNNSGSATSPVATLTVTNDPHITYQPNNAYGLLDGVAQFQVGYAGAPANYYWYYSDLNSNQLGVVTDGTLPSGSIISGSGTSTLTWSNLQSADQANFFVVVSNAYGTVTSSVASLLTVNNTNAIAFWDFNGIEFTNTVQNTNAFIHPASYIGVGLASVVGVALNPPTSPFAGSVDADNGNGFEAFPVGAYPAGYPPHAPPFSWGTSTYPTNGNPDNNKTTGVQFDVSTVGAKNVKLSYECRTTATSSRYYRLQYTTNQSDWVDYPTTTSFGNSASVYLPFSYDFTGFPGVLNNPSFGVRVVAEFQSTATYGVNQTNTYIGVNNNYGPSTGTVTYDLVEFTADAITNNNAAPVINGFTNVNMVDYAPYTNYFTVTDDSTSPDAMQYSAVSLNPSSFSPSFEFGGSGANRTLIIHPNSISQTFAAAPILVTVTDGSGDTATAWFTASIGTVNLPPTNSLTVLSGTNTLANTPLVINVPVGDDRTPVSGLTYSVSSGNSTVVPNDTVNNLIIANQGTGTSPTLTIVPAANQLGQGTVTFTVSDNDVLAPKSTTATFPFMVRPNTNIIALDYFNYDSSGSLGAVSGGYWKQISGGIGQTHVFGGRVTLDSSVNTENIQALLLGAPYKTNTPAVLYASYVVNMDPATLPRVFGSYFTVFNDASGNTANIEDAVVAATNGAALGYYRLGINNRTGATGTNSQMFAMDLLPDSNYVVVTSVVLSNGISTLWVNPNDQTSASVTDSSALTTKFNLGAFELRTSGINAGAVRLSLLKVGTSFDSVFPSLHARVAGPNVVVESSDGTIDLESTPDLTLPFVDLNATTPYTNSNTGIQFFRFKK